MCSGHFLQLGFIIAFALAADEDAAVPPLLAYVGLHYLLVNDVFEADLSRAVSGRAIRKMQQLH